jgi:hypothetical protein
MVSSHEEHAHEHELVEIVDSETLSAFEHVPHEIITLHFHQRGFAIDLMHDEVIALGKAMAQVVEHVQARKRHPR